MPPAHTVLCHSNAHTEPRPMATANTYVNVKRVFNTQPEAPPRRPPPRRRRRREHPLAGPRLRRERRRGGQHPHDAAPAHDVPALAPGVNRGVLAEISPSIVDRCRVDGVDPTVDRRRGMLLSFGVMMSCQVGGRWGSTTGVNNFVFAGFGIPFGLTFIVRSGAKIIVRGARVDGVAVKFSDRATSAAARPRRRRRE